jgi:transposase
VTGPAGHTSRRWTPAVDPRAQDAINITCARGDCRDGPSRARWTRTARRTRTIRPRAPHEALLANRQRPPTPEVKAKQARRGGLEGTLAYGVHTCGMRRARDLGLANTHLQPCASAAVMHLARLMRWLSGAPPAHTRQTPFQKRQQAAA